MHTIFNNTTKTPSSDFILGVWGIPKDGVLEDWRRPRGHLEDKILWPWPWPRQCAAMALASRRSGR